MQDFFLKVGVKKKCISKELILLQWLFKAKGMPFWLPLPWGYSLGDKSWSSSKRKNQCVSEAMASSSSQLLCSALLLMNKVKVLCFSFLLLSHLSQLNVSPNTTLSAKNYIRNIVTLKETENLHKFRHQYCTYSVASSELFMYRYHGHLV